MRYVVREALGSDAGQVPNPRRRADIEHEQRLFDQRGQELDCEEWIAARLVEHQVGQRPHVPLLRTQSIGKQALDVVKLERSKPDFLQPGSRCTDCCESARQWMRRVDL